MEKVHFKTKRFVIRNLKVSDVNISYLKWFKDKQNIKYIEFKPNNNLSSLKKNVKELPRKLRKKWSWSLPVSGTPLNLI